jgi:hypothetical protein
METANARDVVAEQRKTAERPLRPAQPEVDKRKQEKPDSRNHIKIVISSPKRCRLDLAVLFGLHRSDCPFQQYNLRSQVLQSSDFRCLLSNLPFLRRRPF